MGEMQKTVAIIQARLGSVRLPSKVARRLGGQSLLEIVVRRVTDSQCLDAVLVAAGDGPGDERIAELVPPDVPVFFGSERDVLGRYISAIDSLPFSPDAVLRVCADNPFIDPALIDRLVTTGNEHPRSDYIGYCTRDGRPAILSPLGLFGEWCRVEALRRADREARSAADREHVTRYLYAHPESFRVRLIPMPEALDRDDVRLTVDLEEDWEHAQAIFDALGPERLEWQRIAALLDSQPGLRRQMANLNRQYAKV
jgi:spore coat polysaccharide biosynthesis protein SpsF